MKRNREIFKLLRRASCSECIYVRESKHKYSCEQEVSKFIVAKSFKGTIECDKFWNREFADIKNELNCFICNDVDASYVQRIKDGKIRLLCNKHCDLEDTYTIASRLIQKDLFKIVSEGDTDKKDRLGKIVKSLSKKEADSYEYLLTIGKIIVKSLNDEQVGTLGKLRQKGLINFYSLKKDGKTFKAVGITERVNNIVRN